MPLFFSYPSKRNVRIIYRTPGNISTALPRALAVAELHALDDDLRHIALASIIRVIAARLDALDLY